MFRELLASRKRTLVNSALDELLSMVENAERMFGEATSALLDAGPEPDISREDQDINVGERLVRRLIFHHLLTNPQQDLSTSLAILGVVHEAERMGDYAKSLMELHRWGALCAADNPYKAGCRDVRDAVLPLFGKALAGLRDSDTEAAREVMQIHLQVKERTSAIMEAALADPQADRRALVWTVVALYIRRISAHLSNVASSVVNPLDRLGRKEAT
ncbi:MAG: PhoU domain-containing protein [Gemmatimonadota bacterium]